MFADMLTATETNEW